MNPAARSRHAALTVLLLCVGVGLMVPFSHPATLVAGFACLLGFVISGVVLICRPAFLERDTETAQSRGNPPAERRLRSSR